ncbi:DUF2946 domain-containing protein [Xylophilus sp.]|uniref:DUF2946 domain-containing protein n=1 Tax=Xylophilus sp. TaxID=2653893 RepID=UPI0013B5C749|nr:DUF2946 domain-containing protein [Xylophilus sp.]KAF1045537.1 MAG: hypothetical protein GAK38_02986 [Xylophilus sp.]
MQTLRHARFLASLVLAWFALFVAVSVASAALRLASFEMVCAGASGMKLIVAGDDGSVVKLSAGMDCPLCMTLAGPPPRQHIPPFVPHCACAHALRPAVAARLAWMAGASLPPRGPPAFS